MVTIDNSSTILVVDDNNLNLDLLCRVLSKANYKAIGAIDGEKAISQVNLAHPELILLDVMMPNIDGFEVFKLLKENFKTRKIPIIFMTSLADTATKVKAFEIGVDDYIVKPFQKSELLARVRHQLHISNLTKTLADQNRILQNQIDQKYEAEISLLEVNERLAHANQFLKNEIENHKTTAKTLQTEILERKQAEQKVKQSLKEKNLLLKEIHHRVKNNLFIVSSLLESQIEYINDLQVIKMLENSQNRITSMALIHEQLHCATSLFKIDLQQYITTLIEHISDSYLTKKINFHIDIPQLELNIETAHPCGLIVNELVSNALEHAFCDRQNGNIQLKFSRDEFGCCSLQLEDDGMGFPSHKNFYQSESLGLELVLTLVEQLEGKIEMNSHNGTQIEITFKELDYKDRL